MLLWTIALWQGASSVTSSNRARVQVFSARVKNWLKVWGSILMTLSSLNLIVIQIFLSFSRKLKDSLSHRLNFCICSLSQFSVRLSFIFKVATQKLNSVNDSCCCRSGRHKLTVPLLLSNRDYELFSTLHRHCIDPKTCTAEQWQYCAAPVLSMQFLLDSQSCSSLSPLAASSEVSL